MLTPLERAIIDRLSPYCLDCEDYVRKLKVIDYQDHLEVFCAKHGNGIPSRHCGSNCLLEILRFPTLQEVLKRQKIEAWKDSK